MDTNFFTGFTNIIKKEISLHKEISVENIRLIYGDYRRLYIIDASEINEADYDRNINYNIISKTLYEDQVIRFYPYWKDNLVYHYANFISREEMKREVIKSILKTNYFTSAHQDGWKSSNIIIKLEYDNGKYYMNYYLNDNVIKDIVETKRNNFIELLTRLLISQKKDDIFKESNNKLHLLLKKTHGNPYVSSKQIEQNGLLKNDISLYNYQKEDILWMKNIEIDVDNGNNIICYDNKPFYNVLNDMFLLYNNMLFPPEILNNNYKLSSSFKYFGGNIISEVGLGKTLICLYHILSNNTEMTEMREKLNHFVDFSIKCNYFYKRGKQRGLTCKSDVVNDDLYCNEHKDSVFIDKRSLIFKNLNDFCYKDFLVNIDDKNYIKTNSTLIICPNQLCDQWVNEYYSKFNSNHRILLIVTYDQYKNLTLGDFLFSDLVIISYSFLTNNNYTNDICKLDINKFKTDENITNEGLLHSKCFNAFHFFKWDRIILDEAHEIENNVKCNFLQNIIFNSLKSNYKWNVTGTPFPNKLKSFFNLMSYNTNYIKNYSVDYLIHNTSELIKKGLDVNTFTDAVDRRQGIIDKCSILFRRNTKSSIENEYSSNILLNSVKLLTFTNQERSIYDSYLMGYGSKYSDFLIKLCCHPDLDQNTKELIKNCKTFDEIHKCMLDYNKSELSKEKKKIEQLQKDIVNKEAQIENLTIQSNNDFTDDRIETYRTELQTLKRKLTISKKTHDNIQRTYNYLVKSIQTLKEEEVINCPICLDDIIEDQKCITKCGHKFCWDCIYNTFKQNSNNGGIKCPSCNYIISINDLYLLKEDVKEIDNQCSIELDNIIENIKSTKIGNIIYFLKTTLKKDDKVILFSQWDEILHKVGSKLEQFKINFVYCDGSVYKKKRAISSFSKNSDVNIILLSSRNAASGINLTIANKIILLEPIYGSQEYRKDIESQAVGRADRLGQKRPIQICRFIIKETIEEDIYNNFIDDDKMKILKGT
jgi:SNF2 family DNA or RNA helicase